MIIRHIKVKLRAVFEEYIDENICQWKTIPIKTGNYILKR